MEGKGEGALLTWNSFQREYKGRWQRHEMSRQYSEYKRTRVRPGLQAAAALSEPSHGDPPQQQHGQQAAGVAAAPADHGIPPRTQPATAAFRATNSWNKFQAQYRGLWSREELCAAYAHYRSTGTLQAPTQQPPAHAASSVTACDTARPAPLPADFYKQHSAARHQQVEPNSTITEAAVHDNLRCKAKTDIQPDNAPAADDAHPAAGHPPLEHQAGTSPPSTPMPAAAPCSVHTHETGLAPAEFFTPQSAHTPPASSPAAAAVSLGKLDGSSKQSFVLSPPFAPPTHDEAIQHPRSPLGSTMSAGAHGGTPARHQPPRLTTPQSSGAVLQPHPPTPAWSLALVASAGITHAGGQRAVDSCTHATPDSEAALQGGRGWKHEGRRWAERLGLRSARDHAYAAALRSSSSIEAVGRQDARAGGSSSAAAASSNLRSKPVNKLLGKIKRLFKISDKCKHGEQPATAHTHPAGCTNPPERLVLSPNSSAVPDPLHACLAVVGSQAHQGAPGAAAADAAPQVWIIQDTAAAGAGVAAALRDERPPCQPHLDDTQPELVDSGGVPVTSPAPISQQLSQSPAPSPPDQQQQQQQQITPAQQQQKGGSGSSSPEVLLIGEWFPDDREEDDVVIVSVTNPGHTTTRPEPPVCKPTGAGLCMPAPSLTVHGLFGSAKQASIVSDPDSGCPHDRAGKVAEPSRAVLRSAGQPSTLRSHDRNEGHDADRRRRSCAASGPGSQAQAQAQAHGGMDPRVARLPEFSVVPHALRVQPREALPHDHDRLFRGFSSWIPVNPANLRPARTAIPYEPGLYEWGAVAPRGSAVTVFYLGKAGTLKKQLPTGRKTAGRESLRTRFNKYAVAGRLVGPEAEKDKMALFRELQQRGFRLVYRFKVCDDIEPVDAETCILMQVDYAINFQNNGCRRAPMLPDGRGLKSYHMLDAMSMERMFSRHS